MVVELVEHQREDGDAENGCLFAPALLVLVFA